MRKRDGSRSAKRISGSWIYRIGKGTVRLADGIVNLAVLVLFLALAGYGCYAIWDSRQIYSGADAALYETYKPQSTDTESFEELQKINPEVIGWLTVYGTSIDYPLVQSDDNQKYVNVNAKGEYALSGSLFLDYRNKADFSDFCNIIYGHHMEKKSMFGEVEEFKEQDFFDSHRYGFLYSDGKERGLEFFAFLEDAFSTSSKIFATVDSPNSLDTLISKIPLRFIHPLITSSPALTFFGKASPVKAEVSIDAFPETTIPSSGIFSPVFTVIISPILTSVGETFLPFKFA